MDTVLTRDGLQVGEGLEGRLPEALVPCDVMGRAGGLAVLALVGCVERQDLALESSLGPCLCGALL